MDTILAQKSNLSEHDALMEKIFDVFQKYFLFFVYNGSNLHCLVVSCYVIWHFIELFVSQ